MPNWVYNSVKTTDKKETLKLLHEESEKLEGGIAMLLIPRPADAEDNWYDWNCFHWGNKWGAGSQYYEDGILNFETAWDKMSYSFLRHLAKSIPNFIYIYEEEQGWGGEMEFSNGEIIFEKEWDEPDFVWDNPKHDENEDEFYYLPYDFERERGVTFPSGWYCNANFGDQYYETLEEFYHED